MEWQSRALEIADLGVRAISYQYRYCPRCRREWPAKYQSCPECVHWLGEQPLERTEWQLAPRQTRDAAPHSYELIGANAFIFRTVFDHPPADEQLAGVAAIMSEIMTVANGTVCEVAGYGWLVWSVEGLRSTFRVGCEIERRLITALPRLEGILLRCGKIRWGAWIDQYIVPFDERNSPVLSQAIAKAIFDFEPDNITLSSEAIYQVNRRWEHFVGAPRRLLDGQESWGYRMTGHKRPSALDHSETTELGPFVGRERQLAEIEKCWRGAGQTIKLAITAAAGSGKTRLIREWLRRHADVHALVANFGLFSGAVENFASQLAELPPDRLDCSALVEAILDRIRMEGIQVLVIDDLHWADPSGLDFVLSLLAKLPAGMLVILAARPSGREQLRALRPTIALKLSPLPPNAVEKLAQRLTASKPVATAAALRSKGNPLFVEQFTAWAAEADFHGGQSGPHTLHQIIAARIEHLSKHCIADIRQRLRWGGSWERKVVEDELGRLEAEVGLWLDRLETGDYADRVETARHLAGLERLDYEIFLTSMLLGRPRPRSSRLREAFERLLIGSADQVLADLRRRIARANNITREEISREAQRAADVLFAAFKWTQARDFYELVYADPLWDKDEIGRRLIECRRRGQEAVKDDNEIYAFSAAQRLDQKPNVSALDLPYVWTDLGRLYRCSTYFQRAGEAAIAVNDHGLADWAKRKALELQTNDEVLPRS